MKKTSLLAFAVAAFAAVSAHATTLTFDEMPGNGESLTNGYGGFNWNNATTVGVLNGNSYSGSGYQVGVVSASNVIYNWYGISPVDITLAGPGTFTFNSAVFTSAWDNQTISLEGLLNGVVVNSSGPINITTTQQTLVSLDWAGIDELKIYNTVSHWALDNFTFNGVAVDRNVPEPFAVTLIGAGLLGLAGLRRRKAA